VRQFDKALNDFVSVTQGVDVFCSVQYDVEEIQSCKMFLQTEIMPHDMKLITLSYDESVDHEVNSRSLKAGDTISNANVSLKFEEDGSDGPVMKFTMVDHDQDTEGSF